MAPVFTAYGPHAWSVRFADRPDEAAFHRSRSLTRALMRLSLPGLREVVPGPTTLLLEFTPGSRDADPAALIQALASATASNPTPLPERTVGIPVLYGGPDLERVACHSGLAPENVIERHQEGRYRVLCLGFSPGFPYLGGLDPSLATPRLPTPRLRVPAGSVAIGGEHAGIYSIPSPGGWNLIGQTSRALFSPRASSPDDVFLLRAGDQVRFVPVRSLPTDWDPIGTAAPREDGTALLRIRSTGLGLSLQDAGRPGHRRFGLPASGAMDPVSASWANRLLDNPPEAPVLELCLQGQQLEVLRDGWIAVVGSSQARGLAPNRAFHARGGDRLDFGAPGPSGVWTYLAVPGGFCSESFLGSCSAHPRAGIGHALQAGDTLSTGSSTDWSPPAGVISRSVALDPESRISEVQPIRVWPGPQWDQFHEEQQARLFTAEWKVSSRCDRVGYRLEGPGLSWTGGSLISEPVLPGSIQVPTDGQPIVTLHDGPTLGGYPKIGWIDHRDLPVLVQRRAGRSIRFIPAVTSADQ